MHSPARRFHSRAARRLMATLFLLPLAAAAADEHSHHQHHQHAAAPASVEAAAVPALRIIEPQEGAVVGTQLALVFETPGDIAAMTMDAPVIGTHLHIDSSEFSMMPTSKQLVRLGRQRYLFLFDLPAKPGAQTLKVYWGDAMHRTIESSIQQVTVQVESDTPAQR